MSTEKKLSPCTLRIIRLHSEVGDGGQRVGQRPPTEQSADGPQLFATGCNKSTWPQTLKASQRLKLCFLIKHLQDCTKHWKGKKQPKEKKANRVIKHKHSNPSDSCSYFMTVTTAKRNDTTTTAFEGWSSWTLPGNHQSRNAPPSDDNTNQTRTKWLKLWCLWPLGPIKPTAAEPLQQHYEPRAAAFELLLLCSLNTSRIDHRPVLLVNVSVCVSKCRSW